MRKVNLSQRACLLGFIFVSLLNILLAVILFRTVLAQTPDKKLNDQAPVVVEIAKQAQSPLSLSVIDVNNSNADYQIVNYSVQNTNDKAIRAYVINGGLENGGKVITNFFPAKLFQSGAIHKEELILERTNIKPSLNLSLSVDYVEFADGSAWGENKQERADYITGQRFGTLYATTQLEDLIGKGDWETVMMRLKKPLETVDVPLPETLRDKSEKCQSGFRSGYKDLINFLKAQMQKGEYALVERLAEIRKNLDEVGRQTR